MLPTSKSLLLLSLVACLSVAGCDCNSTTGGTTAGDGGGNATGDGGGNATGDGGGNATGDGGGNATGDGGGNATGDGGGNATGDGGNATGDAGNGTGDAGTDFGMSCLPMTAAQVCPNHCGFMSDGCSSGFDCSAPANVALGGIACTASETCSGSGSASGNTCVSNTVDAGTCTPTTCVALGHSCGLAPDGCGGMLNCWPGAQTMCQGANQACLAQGPLNQQTCVTGTQTCSGSLCSSLPTCAANSPTRLSGVVVTPGIDPEGDGTFVNRVPVPNAVVYIPADPSAPLPSIFEGVNGANPLSCGRCADEQFVAAGLSVLAGAVTNYRGEFTLEGRIPVGVDFNIVIKVGKWRRVVQIPSGTTTACMNATLSTELARLNRNSTDGLAGTHLPHIAIGTGEVDEMECVLRNIGISDAEFTLPSGSGRIHMYRMDGARMGTCTGNTTWGGVAHACSDSRVATNYGPSMIIPNYGCVNGNGGCAWSNASVGAANLYGSAAALNQYDTIVWDCEGDEVQHNTDEPRVETYVNQGGRMFASHFAYTWIENNGTLDQSADWGDGATQNSDTAYISLPTGPTMRARANAVKSLVMRDWLDYLGSLQGTIAGLPLENPGTPQFTVTDPRDRAGANAGPFTDEWVYLNNGGPKIQQLSFNTPYGSDATMTQCGRVAYSGFHVSATDNNDTNDYFPNVCLDDGTPTLTPQELILVFMLFDLNSCVSTGDPVQPPQCTPLTVADVCPTANSACGFLSDGCGGLVDCGGCDPGNYCSINSCLPVPTCTPTTCAALGYTCGQFSDGCGGIADGTVADSCGTCPGAQVCNAGTCGATCTPDPNACATKGFQCGTTDNGCGGILDCGMCPSTDTCLANVCYYVGG